MKLIEALKQIKIIDKRLNHNSARITELASKVSLEMPVYGTVEAQKNEINSLIQSSNDLCKEYLNLKKRIDRTNLQTIVTIGKDSYVLADLLTIRRGLSAKMKDTYSALNDRTAQQRMANYRAFDGKTPTVERMYDEHTKVNGFKHWMELEDEIEVRLEVINATTDLVD